jgi:hypothetical protein
MYDKQEEAYLRKQFWTLFGQYLSPIPSGDAEKINWINYKTGIKSIRFIMDVSNEHAYIAIEISHPDPDKQEKYFRFFNSLKIELEKAVDEKWTWKQADIVKGRNTSRIYKELFNVNIYDKNDWPGIITFLKTRIIALDGFWTAHKDFIEM